MDENGPFQWMIEPTGWKPNVRFVRFSLGWVGWANNVTPPKKKQQAKFRVTRAREKSRYFRDAFYSEYEVILT